MDRDRFTGLGLQGCRTGAMSGVFTGAATP